METGTVAAYFPDRAYGFINTPDGQRFMFADRDIMRGYPHKGAGASFVVTDGRRPHAVRVFFEATA